VVVPDVMRDLYAECGLTEEEVDNWIRNRFRACGVRLLDDVRQPDVAKIFMYASNALEDGPRKERILKILESKR